MAASDRPDRRRFLAGALASLGGRRPPAPMVYSRPVRRLRAGAGANRREAAAHRHPPSFRAAGVGGGSEGSAVLQAANTTWTPAKSIEDMDRGGVAAAVVSITNPGMWFGDRAVTRRAGPRLQRLRRQAGAGLPEPVRPVRRDAVARRRRDVEGDRVRLRLLKVDGVGLMTSYGDTWLGNPAYRPVMEELNRRKAVVHVHPTAANCCRNLDYAPGVTRAAWSTAPTRRAPSWAWPSAATPRASPISASSGRTPAAPRRSSPAASTARRREPRIGCPTASCAELKKFYYDLAGAANPGAVASLLQLVTTAADALRHRFPAWRHQPRRREDARRARAVQRERPARHRPRERGAAAAAARPFGLTRFRLLRLPDDSCSVRCRERLSLPGRSRRVS